MWDVDLICFISRDRSGENGHLTVLSVPTHEHGTFYHLFKSFLISLGNVV